MKPLFKILPVCLLLIFAGCIVTSIHPFYTEDVTIFDKNLVGEWIGEDEDGSLIFTQDGEKKYKLFLKEEEDTLRFEVHLFKLQNRLFLDLYPQSREKDDETFWGLHFLALHSILFVKQIEPALQLAPLGQQWLKNQIKSDSLCIAHETIGDRLILTASSKELQNFIINRIQTEDAFDTIDTYHRKPAQ
jgi:hypothetical protein